MVKSRFLFSISSYVYIVIGAFISAFAIKIFLLPNHLIDGGIIGLSMIIARAFGSAYMSLFIILLNIPFLWLAYLYIKNRAIVILMPVSLLVFATALSVMAKIHWFYADTIEAIIIGGGLLGLGVGLILRGGGCTDGTEILAIIVHRKKGFTIGQIIIACNVLVFIIYGALYDVHIALKSFITYLVASKAIDYTIAGVRELKTVLIVSRKSKSLRRILTKDFGLGLTILKGEGGFSSTDQDVLFLVVDRLDLAEVKDFIISQDATAFIVISDLNELVLGQKNKQLVRRRKQKNIQS